MINEIIGSAWEDLLDVVVDPQQRLSPELPEEIAEPVRLMPGDWANTAQEAWRKLHTVNEHAQKKAKTDRKESVRPLEILIVLAGAAVLLRVLMPQLQTQGRISQTADASRTPSQRAPRPATLLLVIAVDNMTRVSNQLGDRILNRPAAGELGRIAQWLWHGDSEKASELWESLSSSASASSNYDFQVIRVDMKREDERFRDASAMVRAEAFKNLVDLSSGPLEISERVSSEVLTRIPFLRL